MSEFPSLAEIAAMHSICSCGEWADNIEEQGRHIADAWREACTIHTVEQLDRVPARAIVQSSAGTIACRFDGRNGVVFGDDRPFAWHKLALPALLIWHPDWARP